MEKKYIDAEAFKRRVMESAFEANKQDIYDIAKGICEMVDYMESADVAPVVHGEWCWEGKFKACSECGSYVEWNETLGANFWKYCPYCGAKMDGGDQDG